MSNSKLMRISFNTAFIGASNKLECTRWNISPEDLHKDYSKFENDFFVRFEFKDYCKKCQSHVTELDDICKTCLSVCSEEINNWRKAKAIMDKHDFPSIEVSRKLIKPSVEFLKKAETKTLKWDTL